MKIESLEDIEKEVDALINQFDAADEAPYVPPKREPKPDRIVPDLQTVRHFERLINHKAIENVRARNILPEIYVDKFHIHLRTEGMNDIRMTSSAVKVIIILDFDWAVLFSNLLQQSFWDTHIYPQIKQVPLLYRNMEKQFRLGFKALRRETQKDYLSTIKSRTNRLLLQRRVEIVQHTTYTAVDIITGHEWNWTDEEKTTGDTLGIAKRLELSRDIHVLDAQRFEHIDDDDDIALCQYHEIRRDDDE